jgi:hypothetical protein
MVEVDCCCKDIPTRDHNVIPLSIFVQHCNLNPGNLFFNLLKNVIQHFNLYFLNFK